MAWASVQRRKREVTVIRNERVGIALHLTNEEAIALRSILVRTHGPEVRQIESALYNEGIPSCGHGLTGLISFKSTARDFIKDKLTELVSDDREGTDAQQG